MGAIQAQCVAQAVHVDGPWAAPSQQIGSLQTTEIQVAEGPAGAQLDAAAVVAPSADQRGQAGDGAHGHAAAPVTLHAVVDADGRRPRGCVGTGQFNDTLSRNTGDIGRPLRRPLDHAFTQLLKTDRVLLNVVGVVQPLADDHVHHGQGQGAICARPNGDPLVSGLGRARACRIDDDDACAGLARFLDEGPQMQIAGQRVAAPDQDQLGLGEGFSFGPLGRADGIEVALESGL